MDQSNMSSLDLTNIYRGRELDHDYLRNLPEISPWREQTNQSTTTVQPGSSFIHNNISNKAKELEELKYNVMRIQKDEDKGTFHLIQCKVTIPELETVLSNPSVIRFVTNATEFITNTNKPTSQSSSSTSQSSLFSILPFVGETQKQNVEVEQVKETEQIKETPQSEGPSKTNEENITEDKSSSDSVKSGFELIEDSVMSLFKNE
jgi:hypothetical protein